MTVCDMSRTIALLIVKLLRSLIQFGEIFGYCLSKAQIEAQFACNELPIDKYDFATPIQLKSAAILLCRL